jgi:hypothetical protein
VGKNAGTLSSIAVGAQVKVRYDSESLVAAEIQVQMEAEAEGTIQAVDTASGQLVIALANGATLTLQLTADTSIRVDHKKATAADLKANSAVEVEYSIETMEAMEVEASTRAEVNGTVKAVDTASDLVTILTQDGKEVMVEVTGDTRVDIKGLLFGILGVTPGMTIKAEFDLTTGEATELKVSAEGRAKGRDEEEKASGTIASIDSAGGKVTVDLDTGGSLTLSVTDDTEIEADGKGNALASLEVGARVNVEYNAETMSASEIEVRSTPQARLEAEVHGTIQVLDQANHQITLRLQDGSTRELVVNSDTVIRINGQPSAEADLKLGMEVEARYQTSTSTALRINTTAKAQAEAEVRGKVKNVNTVARHLVIDTADGKSMVVSITLTTSITKNGQPITLLDIVAGTEVKVQFQIGASGNVAETVEVLGTSGTSLESDASGEAMASTHPSDAEASGEAHASGSASGAEASGEAHASGSASSEGEFNLTVQLP